MKYRKFQADYLFNGSQMLNKSQVLLTDENGQVLDVVPKDDAGEGIEILHGILSPGFVNTHCHLELSHLRNAIPQKTGLVDFVVKVVSGKEYDPAEILSAIEKAEKEMLIEGIVLVGDICNTCLSIFEKEKKRLDYYNFIEASGWNPAVADVRFKKSKIYYDQFIEKGLNVSMVPHAPYSVSGILWGKITPFFSKKVVSIHNQETKLEDQFFLEGSEKFEKMYEMMKIDNSFYKPKKLTSLETYFKKLVPASSVILVHNTFTRQEDIDYINEHKPPDQRVSFCLCVNANLYIEDTLPPINMFSQNTCNIVIGTDSLASNRQLSILEELKTISEEAPYIQTETLLQWATINGAKALQMDDRYGSFEPGKNPGVILISNIIDKKFTKSSVAKRIL